MKRFIFLLTTIFICTIARADNVSINWIVGDNTYATTQCEMGDDLILPTTPTKTGYTFRGWRIAKYIPIEYLESTGTQYILIKDMNYRNINVQTSIEYSSLSPWCTSINFYSKNLDTLFINQIDTDNKWYLYFNNTVYETDYLVTTNRKYNIKINLILYDSNFITNDQIIQSYTNYYDEVNYISLFASYKPNRGFYNACNVKFYYLKLYDNDVLVRDFIPVLDPDGVPCMYDKVEGKFYYNAGTGQFIAGPVIGE